MSHLDKKVNDVKSLTQDNDTSGIVLKMSIDSSILAKFPKPKPNNVPPVFLHNPVKFEPLMRKVLNMRIKFYVPNIGQHYTKICCQTFDDHKALTQYFRNKHLPYHTYGHPNKRKMKVVFKGLPNDIDLDKLKNELGSVQIPINRVHIMKNSELAKDLPPLVLVVVPNNDEGRKILQVEKIFGHNIRIEPPKPKSMQCYRCQKWGHAQRYCQGAIKCVKCGGDHFSKKCPRDPNKEPPKCANCGSDHTSNYKMCPFSPDSPQYIEKMAKCFITRVMSCEVTEKPKKLVTVKNCDPFIKGRI